MVKNQAVICIIAPRRLDIDGKNQKKFILILPIDMAEVEN